MKALCQQHKACTNADIDVIGACVNGRNRPNGADDRSRTPTLPNHHWRCSALTGGLLASGAGMVLALGHNRASASTSDALSWSKSVASCTACLSCWKVSLA